LADVPPATQANLRFQWQEASQLLSSPYPVHRIWEAHQPGSVPGEIHLDSGGAWLLVFRRDYSAGVEGFSEAAFRFLAALQRGECLGDACEQALALDASVPVGELLPWLVKNQVLTDFR
jgi:hypothetical protein